MTKLVKLAFAAPILTLVSAQDGYVPLCSSDLNCGYGTCVASHCQCAPGYRSIIGEIPCTVNSTCSQAVATDCNYDKNGGTCGSDNTCTCDTNFIDGQNECSVKLSCDPAESNQCNNGICLDGSRSCLCNDGYYSLNSACDTYSMPCYQDSMCGNGICNTNTSQCVCDIGWTYSSVSCDGCTDDSSCGNGKCDKSNKVCKCDSGWAIGSTYQCDKNSTATGCESNGYSKYCKNSGKCSLNDQGNPVCTCDNKWYGDRCESENYCHDHVCNGVNETCVINANLTEAFCQNSNDLCPAPAAASCLTFSIVSALFINSIL